MCKKCSRIGAIATKKGKTAKVDLVGFGKAAGISLLGFGLSNYATAKISERMAANGRNPLNANTAGLVKIGLGVATAWAGTKYMKSNKSEVISLAVGMGTSGVADLTRKNVPQVATFLGLGANNIGGYPMRLGADYIAAQPGASAAANIQKNANATVVAR